MFYNLILDTFLMLVASFIPPPSPRLIERSFGTRNMHLRTTFNMACDEIRIEAQARCQEMGSDRCSRPEMGTQNEEAQERRRRKL
jgi:hypothetical protein